MKLGLLGYPLGHSWSKEIHEFLIDEKYEMFETEMNNLDDFMKKKDFDGINVTIPYKEKVIPYLDELSDIAKESMAVNCITNVNGKLKGYNTDALGFGELLDKNGIDVSGKKVAILGSGGAAKGCRYILNKKGAIVDIVSRSSKEDYITYNEMYNRCTEYNIIVNTTPLGLYPNTSEMPPIALNLYSNVEAIIDVLANPLCTRLMLEAKQMGIKVFGGFEMLVYQAAFADEIFLGKKLDKKLVSKCLSTLLLKKANIVLIGMPTSGKTTIAKILSEKLNKEYIDMDAVIEKSVGMKIKDIFKEKGEDFFRKEEKKVAKKISSEQGLIIASGGGVVKDKETMGNLSQNSIVIWIDRNKEDLMPSDDRPLALKKEDIDKLYEERYHLYQKYADYQVTNSTLEQTVEDILEILGGNDK